MNELYLNKQVHLMFKYLSTLLLSVLLTLTGFAQTKLPEGTSKQAELHLDTGLSYYKKSELDKASHHLNLAKQQAVKDKDTATLARAMNAIGRVHSDKGENPTALSFYQKALALAEKTKDDLTAAHIEKNIGVLYISWKNFDKALQHYEIAQKIALKLGDDKLTADCYNNKGTVYEQLEQYPKALEAYGKALSFYQKNKSLPGIAMSYSNMAIVHKQQKQYQQAISYNLKALDIMEKMGEKWMQAATLNNIGSVYYSMGSYKNTLIYCEKSASLANSINAKEIEVAAYETLADAAAALKDFPLAYRYMSKFHKVSQDFINTEKTRQFSELEVKYKTEKKEQQISILNKQATIQQLKIAQHNQTIVVLASGALLLAIIGYLYLNKRKLQQQALMQKEVQNEKERIARDLHDNVGGQLSYIIYSLDGINHEDEQTRTEVTESINQSVRSVVGSLRETIWAISDANIKTSDLSDKLKVFTKTLFRHTDTKVSFTEKLTIEKELNALLGLNLYRVCQEILNNAFKHSYASKIDIEINGLGELFSIKISDNGVGFDTEDASLGKNSYGLSNIKKRASEFGIGLNLVTGPQKGTSYILSI